MDHRQACLDWIDSQKSEMAYTVETWAKINSGSFHLRGVANQRENLADAFTILGVPVERVPADESEWLSPIGETLTAKWGDSLHLSCRPEASLRVLLAIHMDTVYGKDSPFQSVSWIDENTLRGPGVADAKGGLVVMLFALQAFEQFMERTGNRNIGWEVIINADEEVGSPGSARLFEECAERVQLGLLFEPSLPDGRLISSRKGSGNFSMMIRGQSAHAGREFDRGRNAVVRAAALIEKLHGLNKQFPDLTLNVARVDGGGPSNVVPDLAIIRFNIRYLHRDQEDAIRQSLREIAASASEHSGFTAALHGDFSAPPKELDAGTESLLHDLRTCGKHLGLDLTWQPTGGVCDGNRLAACGVPNVDTLGPRGGNIHSDQEYVLIDSLPERAKLTARFLMQLAEKQQSNP